MILVCSFIARKRYNFLHQIGCFIVYRTFRLILVWETVSSYWGEQISKFFIGTKYVQPFIPLLANSFLWFVKNMHLNILGNSLFAQEYAESCTFLICISCLWRMRINTHFIVIFRVHKTMCNLVYFYCLIYFIACKKWCVHTNLCISYFQ